jgi:beta-lactam-binding protein with PASTA domain
MRSSEKVKLMLERGAADSTIKDVNGLTPAEVAKQMGMYGSLRNSFSIETLNRRSQKGCGNG